MSLRELRKRFKNFNDWMIFMYLLSEADEKGFVHKSIREIVKEIGVPQTNLWRSIKRLSGTETEHFLEQVEGVVYVCNIDSYKDTFLSCGTPFGTEVERSTTLAHTDNTRTENNHARPQINTPTSDNKLSKQDNKETTPTKVGVSKKEENVAAIAATPSNKLEVRKADFYNSLVPFLDKYPKEMLRDFYEYWSESNRSMTKMRFEQQPTWEVGKRLAKWASKDNKFNQYGSNRKTQQQINDEQRTIAASVVARLMQENKPVN